MVKKMDAEFKYGQTEHDMMVSGAMESIRDMAGCATLAETYILENGLTICNMATAR